MMTNLGQYIRELRGERDLSLREFAKNLGRTAPFISDIELGRRYPSEKVLAEMAQILQVGIEDLKRHDTRPPLEEIKRITEANPRYAMAFRTVIARGISPERLMNLPKAGHRSARSAKGKK